MKTIRRLTTPRSNFTVIDNYLLHTSDLSSIEKIALFKLQAFDWTCEGRQCEDNLDGSYLNKTDRAAIDSLVRKGFLAETRYGLEVVGAYCDAPVLEHL